MRLAGLTLVLVLAAPGVARTQGPVGPAFDHEIRAAATLGLVPRALSSAPVLPLPEAPPLARSRRHDKSLGVTLMLIGGGAVVVGAVAGGGGGTVLIVGGLVCAGYGFYLYTE